MKALLAAVAVARVWTPAGIATDQYEATPTFTPDGREMYFMPSDPQFERYRLMMSRCVQGAWSKPAPPSFARNGVQEGDPGITPDGKRLYFISMRHDPKGEDFDIWYVERTDNGAWGNAQRLPEPVNSRTSELLPRADRDGRLYFGSDRPGGFGRDEPVMANGAFATSDRRSALLRMNTKPTSRRTDARSLQSSIASTARICTASSARTNDGSSVDAFPRMRMSFRSARCCRRKAIDCCSPKRKARAPASCS